MGTPRICAGRFRYRLIIPVVRQLISHDDKIAERINVSGGDEVFGAGSVDSIDIVYYFKGYAWVVTSRCIFYNAFYGIRKAGIAGTEEYGES